MDPEVDKKTLALLTASSTVQKHNCLFLIQDTSHSTLYQPPKSHLFINAIQPLCQTGTGLVIMQSQKETTPILKLLEDANIRACEIKGHSEIVEVRSAVKESQEKAIPVIVTSSNCAMYMFCLGLVRMESLSFIFFDNLTGANKNHPYCMIMEVLHVVFFIIPSI